MSSLPWIKVDVDLEQHPKAIALSLELGVDDAWLHMVRLWLWAAKSCPAGRIEGRVARQLLERAAGWKGTPGAFVAAAIAVGFVDEAADGALELHQWAERNAAHVAKQVRDREAAAKKRGAGTDSPPSRQRVVDDSPATPRRAADEPPTSPSRERETEREREIPSPSEKVAAAPEAPPSAAVEGAVVLDLFPSTPVAQGALALGQPVAAAAREARPPKPAKVRALSAQETLWREMQRRRLAALPEGMPPLPDPRPQVLNKLLGDLLDPGHFGSEVRLLAAWEHYFRDSWARGLGPPYPLEAFASQWVKHCPLPEKVAAAPISYEPPPRSCECCDAPTGEQSAPLCPSCDARFRSGPASDPALGVMEPTRRYRWVQAERAARGGTP